MREGLEREKHLRLAADEARKIANRALAQSEADKGLAQQAQHTAEIAQRKEAAARQQSEAEKKRAQWEAYVARLQPMRQAWLEKNYGLLEHLLEQSISGQGEPDFRGWEWYFLYDQVHRLSRKLDVKVPHTPSVDWCHANNKIALTVDGGYVHVLNESGERVERIIRPSKSQVRQVAWSPDGKLLACTHERRVTIWSVSTGELLRGLSVEQQFTFEQPGALAWSNDGHKLAASAGGSIDGGEIKIWDTSRWEIVKTLNSSRGESNSYVCDLDWHPDNVRLASAIRGGLYVVWDCRKGEALTKQHVGRDDPLDAVGWSPDGKLLATAHSNGLAIWAENGHPLFSYDCDLQYAGLEWSPNSQSVAAGGNGQALVIWDRGTEKLRDLTIHGTFIRDLTWSSDQKRILVAGDSIARLVSVEEEPSFPETQDRAHDVRWSPNSKLIACLHHDNLKVYDAVTKQELTVLYGSHVGVAWGPDNTTLYTLTKPNKVVVWEMKDPKQFEQKRVKYLGKRVYSNLEMSPDGRMIALRSGDEIEVWDSTSWQRIGEISVEFFCDLSFSPSGKAIAIAYKRGILLWNVSNQTKRELMETEGFRYTVCWSPDGEFLVASRNSGEIGIFYAIDGRKIFGTPAHRGEVSEISWSRDGRRLLTGGKDGTLSVWDFATGGNLIKFVSHAPIRELAWSPDGRRIAVTSESGDLQIWGSAQMPEIPQKIDYLRDGAIAAKVDPLRPETEFSLLERYMYFGSIVAMKATPDERLLVVAGYFQGLKLWDIEKAHLIEHLEPIDETFWSVDIAPDGKYVAASSFSGKLHLWELDSGKHLRSFVAHHPKPGSNNSSVGFWVRFSPNGKQIASFGQDRFVRFWNLAGKRLQEYSVPMQVYRGIFTPNEKYFAFGGSGEGHVLLLNLQTDELQPLTKHPGELVRGLAVTSDSRFVLAGYNSGKVRLSNLDTGEEVQRFDDHRSITQLEFLPGDRFFLSAGVDGQLHLWDVKQPKQPIAKIDAKESIVETMALLDNGRKVFSAGWMTKVRTPTSHALHLWRLPTMLWSEESKISPSDAPEPAADANSDDKPRSKATPDHLPVASPNDKE